MSKLSEQDVVSFLKEKVASLKQELKKAEDGLAFFTGSSLSEAPKTRGPKSKAAKMADTVVEKARKGTRKNSSSKVIDVPTEFSDSLKRDSKIIYVLNSLQSGNAEEVTDELMKLEPGQDQEKLHRLVTQRLSALSLRGNLKSVKQGRKSSYSIR